MLVNRCFPALVGCLALLGGFLETNLLQGQDKADPRGVLVEDIRNTQPSFLVRVAVDRADRTYRGGDELRVTVQSEREGYLYLFYLNASKQVSCLFPNRLQKDNKIPAAKVIAIPAADAKFRLRVAVPFGVEVLKAIVTLKPLDVAGLDLATLTQNEVTGVDLNRLSAAFDAVRTQPGRWAEHSVEINTVAPQTPPSTRTAKRVGLFVGISKYKADSIEDLACCHTDAIKLAEVMKQKCGLDELPIILTDKEATLAAVEKAIRKQLTALTRPGDVVFLFWSGHGDRIVPEGGTGRMESLLVPYEGDNRDVAAKRKTMLLASTLMRWLQDLDGRRIVFIVDACFAAGLDPKARTFNDPTDNEPFFAEFVARSKALGQKETSLLASSLASEISWVRNERDLSLLTYYLVEFLNQGDGPATLSQAFDYVKPRVIEYANKLSTKLRKPELKQTPQLIDDITPPFQLRLAARKP